MKVQKQLPNRVFFGRVFYSGWLLDNTGRNSFGRRVRTGAAITLRQLISRRSARKDRKEKKTRTCLSPPKPDRNRNAYCSRSYYYYFAIDDYRIGTLPGTDRETDRVRKSTKYNETVLTPKRVTHAVRRMCRVYRRPVADQPRWTMHSHCYGNVKNAEKMKIVATRATAFAGIGKRFSRWTMLKIEYYSILADALFSW